MGLSAQMLQRKSAGIGTGMRTERPFSPCRNSGQTPCGETISARTLRRRRRRGEERKTGFLADSNRLQAQGTGPEMNTAHGRRSGREDLMDGKRLKKKLPEKQKDTKKLTPKTTKNLLTTTARARTTRKTTKLQTETTKSEPAAEKTKKNRVLTNAKQVAGERAEIRPSGTKTKQARLDAA